VATQSAAIPTKIQQDCELSVARAAGDHDRSGTYTFVVGQLEGEAAWIRIAPIEPNHLNRDRHFDPEFLRLVVGMPVGKPR
jgi:hypothetical protein